MNLRKLKILLFLHLQMLPMLSKRIRPWFLKQAGAQIQNYKKTFIGEDVTIDTNFPQDITIKEGVRVTVGGILKTHFLDVETVTYYRGKITFKKCLPWGENYCLQVSSYWSRCCIGRMVDSGL